MNILLGMKILCRVFWGPSQNWAIFKGHFYTFKGIFLRPRYRIGDIFGVAIISNIFGGA